MPLTNDPEAAQARRAAQAAEREHAQAYLRGHPDEWMDDMIRRLLLETGKQLSFVENTKALDVRDQAQHARTLASLERTLERLSRMQSERASRERKVAMTDDEARTALERRLDKLLAGGAAPEVAE